VIRVASLDSSLRHPKEAFDRTGPELVEGGQLLAMFVDPSVGSPRPPSGA